jgi:hypothetical protein
MTKICMSCAGEEAQMMVDYWVRRSVEQQDARRLGVPVDDFGRFDARALLAARVAAKEAA